MFIVARRYGEHLLYIRELNQDRTLFSSSSSSARLYWELLYIFPFEGLVVLVLLHRRAPSDSVASQPSSHRQAAAI